MDLKMKFDQMGFVYMHHSIQASNVHKEMMALVGANLDTLAVFKVGDIVKDKIGVEYVITRIAFEICCHTCGLKIQMPYIDWRYHAIKLKKGKLPASNDIYSSPTQLSNFDHVVESVIGKWPDLSELEQKY